MNADVCKVAPLSWARHTIADVCRKVTSGGTPSRKIPQYYHDGKWPWVKSKELLDCWIDDTEEHITEEALQYSSAKMLPPNTVLLALYGATVGQLGILRKPMTCNQACCAIVVDEKKADYHYVFYQLFNHRAQLKNVATGAAQQNLSGDLIKALCLPFPPVGEQKAIAHILGTLDDKIELNRQMNETLEQMARAIFKSWFVDFDPVKAKAEGKKPTGMNAETAKLFPDSFADSELGPIPKGWKVIPIGGLCKVTIGGDWGNDKPFEGAVESICLRGCDMEVLRVSGYADAPRRWIKESSMPKRVLSTCDVLIAASGAGPCGRSLWASNELVTCVYDFPVIYSNFVKRLRTSSPSRAVYLDRILFEKHRDNSIWEYINGTSVPNLDAKGLLAGGIIILPPDSILEKFYEFMIPVYSKLYSRESQTLASIRNTLLPKLLSGEIRVKDS